MIKKKMNKEILIFIMCMVPAHKKTLRWMAKLLRENLVRSKEEDNSSIQN